MPYLCTTCQNACVMGVLSNWACEHKEGQIMTIIEGNSSWYLTEAYDRLGQVFPDLPRAGTAQEAMPHVQRLLRDATHWLMVHPEAANAPTIPLELAQVWYLGAFAMARSDGPLESHLARKEPGSLAVVHAVEDLFFQATKAA